VFAFSFSAWGWTLGIVAAFHGWWWEHFFASKLAVAILIEREQGFGSVF
jgi:hypothetical protein